MAIERKTMYLVVFLLETEEGFKPLHVLLVRHGPKMKEEEG